MESGGLESMPHGIIEFIKEKKNLSPISPPTLKFACRHTGKTRRRPTLRRRRHHTRCSIKSLIKP